MSEVLDADAKVNLSRASVLLVESTQHAVDLLAQIVKGFGVRDIFRCISIEEAEKVLSSKSLDLIVMEPNLREGDGYAFISNLRRSKVEPNCNVPAIIASGPAFSSAVAQTRDCGANFYISKPLTPHVLLERLLWIGREKRQFVDCPTYVGPDRRFKFEGPPPGCEGRRATDAKDPIGQPAAPNLSQDEISSMIKPQRVAL